MIAKDLRILMERRAGRFAGPFRFTPMCLGNHRSDMLDLFEEFAAEVANWSQDGIKPEAASRTLTGG